MKPGYVVIIVFVFLTTLLGGCATEYGPRNFFGEGYSEARIGADIFRVDFECSGETPESLCDGYLFRRCAELTLKSGYDYFTMLDHTYDLRQQSYYVPGHMNTVVTGYGKDKKTSYTYTPGYTATKSNPIASATIRISAGGPAGNNQNTFDAREILKYSTPQNK
jgi:hypothetical protein